MSRLFCQTAGESHGPAVLAVVTGMPAGLRVNTDSINAELARRQQGYGRGARQAIERDTVTIMSGTRQGVTIGSPVTLQIANRDNRIDDPERTPPLHRPRPGHADLAGSLKWLTTDCRPVLERASARETAARVAAGALARQILETFGIRAFAFVRSIATVSTRLNATRISGLDDLIARRNRSQVACPDEAAEQKMIEAIRQAKRDKDTLGGVLECHVLHCPPGLGSCANWYDKLDARLAASVMSIQAIKSVEIGLGLAAAHKPGSKVHDPITYDPKKALLPSLGYGRTGNNAGGIEGGMSNGQPIVVRAAMKPISTLLRGLPSVDLVTHEPSVSQYERSDICAVPAASVVVENVVAFEIAAAFLDKFGGDTMDEVQHNYQAFLDAARHPGPFSTGEP